MSKRVVDYDAVVIGAGFSGIRSLWELDQLGLTVKCFDAASDVGGTWYWNRYPGSRTDGEAWVYILNFAPELLEEWQYHERYPTQEEIQRYLSRIADRYNLRKYIEFGTRIAAASYSDAENIWTITTENGRSTTCRYFLPATGILSIPKKPPFPGLSSYTGEWYQASNWPAHEVDFYGKRIAIIGTGSTGIHLVPKLAPIAKDVTVFQRTPNYVLPGRNHSIDEYQVVDIKKNHEATWELAKMNIAGAACKASGRTVKSVGDADKVRQILDHGWERGCFNFQLETFDDAFMDPESNEQVSEFIRQKIRAIVQDPNKAELLCPKYPFGARRPPSGHFYYEAFNRPNVNLVDMSRDEIDLFEKGVRTNSGAEYEFDMIIFALGFDAGTGAMNQIDIKGSRGKVLKEYWNAERLGTFAGVLVSGFPNMFIVCGPHMPAGNLPVPLELSVNWIGKTIRHMEENNLAVINVTEDAMHAWSDHHDGLWNSVFISQPAKENRSWFVGTNIPGKPANIMFYFGGVQNWLSWLNKELDTNWGSMEFTPLSGTDKTDQDAPGQTFSSTTSSITAEMLESAVMPLQSDEVGMTAAEKFNLGSAACARYIDWAVKEIHDGGLAVKQDHRAHWWQVLQDFVKSESGQVLIQQGPSTKSEMDQLTSRLGIEGEAIHRIGPELVRMLTGQTHPLALILRDDLLFRMYHSDEGARPNQYMADYAKFLCSKKKDLRILEIGAGTGGTTLKVLQACSPDGEFFCSEYMYTDISPGFFKTSQTTLKKWERVLKFQTLNVENDAAKQGFEEHAYDLIIAANVVHATQSLTRSLGTIHKLLKPGGKLGLVELTRLTPYFNMAFGSLSGWWAGVGEGRTESPLQSPEQWGQHLKSAGFSGVDLAAYDLPEPESHSALLVSTALAVDVATNGY
ncbi:Phenylacetone monooxygenase [Metarhizium anisopliae BRIP 53293]|uniref:Phenylacetone monooxygenase n=1 Tax=Metarhizium anisopliae BRIP 53293 TaxID=1291518 RepID=A0A0D9NJV8_METAN|nr:Phenylacetone monooxygenase [Metarhizium anisopliae BRIP 53293]KJK92469.1 Phenylacetone monooxygenase [Metarhizium anisopliae BRIP 53284]